MGKGLSWGLNLVKERWKGGVYIRQTTHYTSFRQHTKSTLWPLSIVIFVRWGTSVRGDLAPLVRTHQIMHVLATECFFQVFWDRFRRLGIGIARDSDQAQIIHYDPLLCQHHLGSGLNPTRGILTLWYAFFIASSQHQPELSKQKQTTYCIMQCQLPKSISFSIYVWFHINACLMLRYSF